MLPVFLSDYPLRWWRLRIEERAYRKTRLDGGDYQLRTSALPPPVTKEIMGFCGECLDVKYTLLVRLVFNLNTIHTRGQKYSLCFENPF